MALVNALRFTQNQGAILADDETWSVSFRRRLHSDNLHSLLEPEVADRLGIEVAYGGVGYPSLHREVVLAVRAEIQRRIDTMGKPGADPLPKTVGDVAHLALAQMQRIVRRRLDERTYFYFGVTLDDLNSGSFENDGKKYEIKQADVKKKALAITRGDSKDRLLSLVFEAHCVIFGWDKEFGIIAYHVDPAHSVVSFNREGYEAVGAGKYGSAVSLGEFLNNRTFNTRRVTGFGAGEGLYELFLSALTANRHFSQAGPRFNLVLLDGSKPSHADRYREVSDERSALAAEIASAGDAGFLAKPRTFALMEDLVVAGKPVDDIERAMFAEATRPVALDHYLRGYKLEEVDGIAAEDGKRVEGGTK